MKASIHSVDSAREWFADRASKGKTTEVISHHFDASVDEGQLVIRANYSPWFGFNDRGGTPKEITRTLTVTLAPEEIVSIVQAALTGGLVSLKVAVPKQKKPKKLE